ncbi:MAG: hypothetical protein ACXWRA_05385 [Pseudobdellovibrionaceae bacterium]
MKNSMKSMTLGFVLLTSLQSFATQTQSLSLLCSGSSADNCIARVSNALQNMGCEPDLSTVKCQQDSNFEDKMYCTVQTNKCVSPAPDLVFTTHCNAGEKISLKKYERGLSLDWWMGFGPFISSVCKE